MKKFISGLIIGILVSITLTSFAASTIKTAFFNPAILLKVDGKIVDTDIITAVKEGQINGKNYVSARDLAEAMGATVTWGENTVLVTTTKSGIDVTLVNKLYYLNKAIDFVDCVDTYNMEISNVTENCLFVYKFGTNEIEYNEKICDNAFDGYNSKVKAIDFFEGYMKYIDNDISFDKFTEIMSNMATSMEKTIILLSNTRITNGNQSSTNKTYLYTAAKEANEIQATILKDINDLLTALINKRNSIFNEMQK